MSASNEKKRRQTERELEIENQEEIRRAAARSRRRRGFGKLVWAVVIIAVVLFVVVVSVLNSDLMYRLPAAKVGSATYSGAELRYYYMDVYRSLESYQIIDTTKPVAEQDCEELAEEGGGSWHDYIMQYLETSLIRTQALLEGAGADGYTLSEDGKRSVESAMSNYRAAAEQKNVSLKQFMRLYYGDGVTPKLVEKLMTRTMLASEYEQHVKDSFTYTEEELAAYYNEHIDEYRTYSFMYYFVADSAVPEPKEEEEPAEGEENDETAPAAEPDEDTDENGEASPYYLDENGEAVPGPDGEPIEIQYVLDENGEIALDENGEPTRMELVYDENGELSLDEEGQPQFQEPRKPLTPAQSFANIIANYASDEESFITAVDALKPGDKPLLSEGILKANLPIEWLGEEEREYGNMTIASGENDQGETGCYVLMFVGRDDQHYLEVSARHILVATVDEDKDGTYSEEELAAAREKMDEIQKEWESGEQTELRFAALAAQYSEDTGSNENGGLLEGIYKGQMVEEFNDFCFAEGRKSGDTAVVHGTASNYDGYHLIYYVGEGGRHSDALARGALYAADVSAWNERLLEGYELSYERGSRYMNPGV